MLTMQRLFHLLAGAGISPSNRPLVWEHTLQLMQNVWHGPVQKALGPLSYFEFEGNNSGFIVVCLQELIESHSSLRFLNSTRKATLCAFGCVCSPQLRRTRPLRSHTIPISMYSPLTAASASNARSHPIPLNLKCSL